MNWDEELRAALRPEAPRRDLAPFVLARLRAPAPPPRRHAWQLAIVLLLLVLGTGLGVNRWRMVQRQQRARADARQLAAALHLASAQLAAVRAKVVRTP